MRKYNKLCAIASGFGLMAAGCSQNEDISGPTTTQPVDAPTTPTFTASTCQEVTDDVAAAQLEAAKANIDDIFIQLGKGDLKNAQAISAQTKSSFKSVLDKYPSNCEAQLGYALSIVTDLVNNKQINEFVDTLTNKANLADLGTDDINQLLIAGNGKHLSTMSQEAVAAAIPSLDSAIIYMKNIVADDKFVCHYTYEDRLFELDRGEFAPAVSVLYIAKALLTFGASLDLNVSANGSYDWINDLDQRETATKSSVDQIIALMDKSSSFTTVYSSWKSRYKEIPNLLDSAITYVEIGLQYGIEEAKTGILTQQNDPYIVGDGEFADVSAKDFQKVIDSLEYYRQKIHTGFTVTFPHGTKITVNPAKFFEITDGWQDFLPYHKINDYTQWNTPVDAFYWDEDPDYTYAENEYEDALFDQISKTTKVHHFYASLYNYGGWYGEEPTIKVCVDFEVEGSDFDFCGNVTINNCTIAFDQTASYRDEAALAAYFPQPVKLSSGVCKVENGVSLFAAPVRHLTPNAFYFTDASGKKTISYQALNNGKYDEVSGYYKDYTLDDMQNLIFFPDITFGGIFPGMTVDAFWNFLKTEFRDDEDEDWTIRFE